MSYDVVIEQGHEILRVIAHLTEPVVTTDLLVHLDGPLAWGAFCSLPRPDREALPHLSAPWAVDLYLPLSRWTCPPPEDGPAVDPGLLDGDGQVWGWAASLAVFADLRYSRTEVRKRVPIAEMARYSSAPSAQLASGPMKAYDLPLRTVLSRTAEWRCVGDAAAVRDLLRYVPAIGKKRNIGYGTVARWEVERVDGTLSGVVEHQGPVPSAARVMPSSSGLRGSRGVLAVRPPYHHRSRRMLAVRPTRV